MPKMRAAARLVKSGQSAGAASGVGAPNFGIVAKSEASSFCLRGLSTLNVTVSYVSVL